MGGCWNLWIKGSASKQSHLKPACGKISRYAGAFVSNRCKKQVGRVRAWGFGVWGLEFWVPKP